MIRWTFFFQNKDLKSETNDEAEDQRIRTFIEQNPQGMLSLSAGDTQMMVNLGSIICVARQIVDVEKEKIETEQQHAIV